MTQPVQASLQTLAFAAYEAYLAIVRAALPDVQVYDGPVGGGPDDDLYVIVGTDTPRVDGPVRSIDSGVQDWHGLGGGDREETFNITAVVVATSGEEDYAIPRAAALTAAAAIGRAVRPPPHGVGDGMLGETLNQDGNGTGWCGLAVTGLDQGPVKNGIAVYVPLLLACTALV